MKSQDQELRNGSDESVHAKPSGFLQKKGRPGHSKRFTRDHEAELNRLLRESFGAR
jgi:hypothetical protein